ncbi:MAG: hypothetical protein Q7S40_11355 [Opitutaceae bacterium]|nr:hypothetical protein [Opitutaceae bacterium]
MSSSGFVYVATGSGYLDEARRSAESLRRHHPGVPICLITDQRVEPGAPFTQIQPPLGPVEHKPIDKLLAIEAPYERCVFLDTDTFVLDDLTSIFALLDRFELAAHQDVNRGWNYTLPDVPLAFSEFNTGVIAFRNEPAVQEFFRVWRGQYEGLHREFGFVNDQPAFRRALFHAALRVAPLPSEFHFLGNFPNTALWNVRLIHARGDYAQIAREANGTLGGRAYIPNVGVVPAFAGRKGWLKVTLAIFWRMARLVVQPPRDSAAANPRKWWLDERTPPKS